MVCGTSFAVQGELSIDRRRRAGVMHAIADDGWVAACTVISLATGALCLVSVVLIVLDVKPLARSRIGLTASGLFLLLVAAILLMAYGVV